jgi:predicted alternative tryptophan synthase beta-subunit
LRYEPLSASLAHRAQQSGDQARFGRSLLTEDENHPGTLGIANSEAIEDTMSNDNTRYCLGSVLKESA